jgi:hypothetical protein
MGYITTYEEKKEKRQIGSCSIGQLEGKFDTRSVGRRMLRRCVA